MKLSWPGKPVKTPQNRMEKWEYISYIISLRDDMVFYRQRDHSTHDYIFTYPRGLTGEFIKVDRAKCVRLHAGSGNSQHLGARGGGERVEDNKLPISWEA